MMTKKDFVAIAKIIKEVKEDWDGGTPFKSVISFFEDSFADYFETQNPNFDRDRFIKACNGDCA